MTQHNQIQIQAITLPSGRTVTIPDKTAAQITQSAAKYAAPLWHYRAEKVLKLGNHQWITPSGPNASDAAREQLATHPFGICCLAWKLFNRGWLAHAEAYFVDTETYPNHPRHLGRNVIPLVDEDEDSQQIGWVRIDEYTQCSNENGDKFNYAVFVTFTILDLFPPRPLSIAYS